MLRALRNVAICLFFILGCGYTATADTVGYKFHITTSFIQSCPQPHLGQCGNAEDGFGVMEVINTGSSDFTGDILFEGNLRGQSYNLDFFGSLASHTQVFFAVGQVGTFSESRPFDLSIFGQVTDGTSTEDINLFVSDGDIHSGVFQLSSCDAAFTDSYVLSFGSPTGCDNGLGFARSQAHGNFQFFEAPSTTPPTATPEPGTILLLSGPLLGLMCYRRQSLRR